ncbi:MAG TPA: hypothetical protein VG755_43835 [Nannocystaceae bacterium]|nr:hypothetical protein [Nannocystaceae bacterium]
MNDERDDELDDVLDHADEAAERDVALHVPPSFAAVVARARRIDPSTVSADVRADARASRNVHGVGAHDTAHVDAKLIAPFVLQAREDAEDDIAERERWGVPPLRVRPLVRVRAWTLIGGVMAAAAATIFALGLVEGWRATRVDETPRAQSLAGVDTSPDVHEATQNDGGAQEPASVPRRRTPEAADSPTPPPPSIAPALPPAEEASVPDAIGEMLERASSPKATRSGAAKVPRESLKQLDLRAQAALAAGDRELADKLYTQLIARGQKHPLVELAYGERFALARPHGASAQRSLWRAYLSSFPQGRFADDAEAGLCRTAAAHDKTRCWSAYVAAFPTGAYRDHADRWVADTSAP